MGTRLLDVSNRMGVIELPRREFLWLGVSAGMGIAFGDLFQQREARGDIKKYESKSGKAKSVIHIFLPGGIAHQESFDPKPLSPVEYRGDVTAISTKLPGVQFSSYLDKTAQIIDKLTLCRAVSHVLADHNAGEHQMFTGYGPSPAVQYPSMGSVMSHEFGTRNSLPAYVCVPKVPNSFAGSGYLSSAHGPFALGSEPSSPDFAVRDLAFAEGIDEARLKRSRSILQTINQHLDRRADPEKLQAVDAFYDQAYQLITSKAAMAAFDLKSEPQKVREAYGNNAAGQRMLIARRLVEAGVRFVSLTYAGWDDHFNIAPSIKEKLPKFDQAFPALILDLEQRGLLDSTLVVVATEFGRTPKVNSYAGRDHWSKAFSVMLAGAGIRRGYVHGKTNLTAAEPEDGLLSVRDLLTTMYHLVGIVADKELMAPGQRPIEIVKNGKVVRELLA